MFCGTAFAVPQNGSPGGLPPWTRSSQRTSCAASRAPAYDRHRCAMGVDPAAEGADLRGPKDQREPSGSA
jgi:hypothetical protein